MISWLLPQERLPVPGCEGARRVAGHSAGPGPGTATRKLVMKHMQSGAAAGMGSCPCQLRTATACNCALVRSWAADTAC